MNLCKVSRSSSYYRLISTHLFWRTLNIRAQHLITINGQNLLDFIKTVEFYFICLYYKLEQKWELDIFHGLYRERNQFIGQVVIQILDLLALHLTMTALHLAQMQIFHFLDQVVVFFHRSNLVKFPPYL